MPQDFPRSSKTRYSEIRFIVGEPVQGNPVNSITYNIENFPISVTYNVYNLGIISTETVNIQWDSSGNPSIHGILYCGYTVDIPQAKLNRSDTSSQRALLNSMNLNICAIKDELEKVNTYFSVITDQTL